MWIFIAARNIENKILQHTTVLTKRKFPPRNMQNNFFLSISDNFFFAPVYHGQSYHGYALYPKGTTACQKNLNTRNNIENSYRDRLVPKILGFFSFWGNSGPVSGRNLLFVSTVYARTGESAILKVDRHLIIGMGTFQLFVSCLDRVNK